LRTSWKKVNTVVPGVAFALSAGSFKLFYKKKELKYNTGPPGKGSMARERITAPQHVKRST
jgi:hypothetical protein